MPDCIARTRGVLGGATSTYVCVSCSGSIDSDGSPARDDCVYLGLHRYVLPPPTLLRGLDLSGSAKAAPQALRGQSSRLLDVLAGIRSLSLHHIRRDQGRKFSFLYDLRAMF